MGISKKRGRPRLGTCKDGRINVRISAKDAEKINYLIEKTGKTKTDIILTAIQAQYNFEMFKEN